MPPSTPAAKPGTGPRTRLITSAIALVSEHGVAGTGLKELLADSGTARNSIYQHFPGGKSELIATSTIAGGTWITAVIPDDSTGPAAVIDTVVNVAKHLLRRGQFRHGCPVVAAAVSGPDYPDVQNAAAEVFGQWRLQLGEAFARCGTDAAHADSLATFVISAVEGALIQARAARSHAALDEAALHLKALADLYAVT